MLLRIFITLLVFSSALLSAPTHSVQLLNAGDPLLSDGREFVGPYTLRIDDQIMPALCIDFAHPVQIGQSWSAYLTGLSSPLDHTYHPEHVSDYEAEAYLFSMLFEDAADRVEIQHAAWSITGGYLATLAELGIAEQARTRSKEISTIGFLIVSGSSAREQEFIVRTELAAPEPPSTLLQWGTLMLALALWRPGLRRK